MSPERLNSCQGYVVANCVLVAAEFNTSDYSRNKATSEVHGTAQWTKTKVAALPLKRLENIDVTHLSNLINDARARRQRQPRSRVKRDAQCSTETEAVRRMGIRQSTAVLQSRSVVSGA